jgi:hypothetical protein
LKSLCTYESSEFAVSELATLSPSGRENQELLNASQSSPVLECRGSRT